MLDEGSDEYENEENDGLPTNLLPDVAICGFWDDLIIYQGTDQGIFYQIFGTAGTRSVTFEFNLSSYDDEDDVYHFTVTFYEDQPGVSRVNFIQISLDGETGTVGVQRRSSDQVLVYAQNDAIINDETFVRFDTVGNSISTGNF